MTLYSPCYNLNSTHYCFSLFLDGKAGTGRHIVPKVESDWILCNASHGRKMFPSVSKALMEFDKIYKVLNSIQVYRIPNTPVKKRSKPNISAGVYEQRFFVLLA